MELFQALGLNVKVLIAQFVNFAILVFVLYRFAYKPILKFLDERKDKIEEGLKKAEEAQKKLAQAEESEKEALLEARKEAQAIIAKAQEAAEKVKTEIIENSQKESQKILDDARKKAKEERDHMFREIKGEMAVLVVQAVEKIVKEKIDSAKDKELIETSINNG